MDFVSDVGSRRIGGDIEVVIHLKAKPEAGGVTEETCQAKGCVRGDATSAMHNLVDPNAMKRLIDRGRNLGQPQATVGQKKQLAP